MADPVILYLRCDSIGDHVLSACMLEPLRRAYPEGRIVVVGPDSVGGLYERCPFVDEMVGIPFARFRDKAFRESVKGRLRDFNADVCLNPAYARIEVADELVAATGARERIGHVGDISRIPAAKRESCNQAYTKLIASPGEWKLELARHADFLGGLGIGDWV